MPGNNLCSWTGRSPPKNVIFTEPKYTIHGGEIRNNKLKSKFDGFIFFVHCNIFVNQLYIGPACLQRENSVNKNVKSGFAMPQ